MMSTSWAGRSRATRRKIQLAPLGDGLFNCDIGLPGTAPGTRPQPVLTLENGELTDVSLPDDMPEMVMTKTWGEDQFAGLTSDVVAGLKEGKDAAYTAALDHAIAEVRKPQTRLADIGDDEFACDIPAPGPALGTQQVIVRCDNNLITEIEIGAGA
jgi:hypothetical protein